MDRERWWKLSRASDEDATLTPEEVDEGWHWCEDWDFMLVGPSMAEQQICSHCPKKKESK